VTRNDLNSWWANFLETVRLEEREEVERETGAGEEARIRRMT
jgi:hypothetical protein